MIGETGCGKSSLLRVLSKLKKKGKLKIKNIHVEIEEEDIIQFMEKTEKKTL